MQHLELLVALSSHLTIRQTSTGWSVTAHTPPLMGQQDHGNRYRIQGTKHLDDLCARLIRSIHEAERDRDETPSLTHL